MPTSCWARPTRSNSWRHWPTSCGRTVAPDLRVPGAKPMARTKNRGLTYLRRSTDKQAISLPSQLEWAMAVAGRHDVTLDADLADLAHMQAFRLHSYKAVRLDDGITGSDLTRPGFRAVIDDALSDRGV